MVPRRGKYIVSDEKRFIYAITPKVACSSVKTALAPSFEIDTRGLLKESGQSKIHQAFDESPHLRFKPRLLRELHSGAYDDYFIFSFVRNPFDRLLSCYRQKLSPTGTGLARLDYDGIKLEKGMSFPAFVRAVSLIPDEIANHHFRSQYVTLCNDEGDVIPKFVGRFERLSADFNYVAEQLKIDPALPHILKTSQMPYRELYDSNSLELARARYEVDLRLFDYEF